MGQEEVLRPEEIDELCRNSVLPDVVYNLCCTKGYVDISYKRSRFGPLISTTITSLLVLCIVCERFNLRKMTLYMLPHSSYQSLLFVCSLRYFEISILAWQSSREPRQSPWITLVSAYMYMRFRSKWCILFRLSLDCRGFSDQFVLIPYTLCKMSYMLRLKNSLHHSFHHISTKVHDKYDNHGGCPNPDHYLDSS